MSRDLTAASMRWNNIIKNFEIQWKALKAKKDKDTPEVPKISKSLPIIKWMEAFQDHLNRVISVWMIPLAYVTRTNEDVPAVAPPLQVGQPHSEEQGSIEGELITRASHTHAIFRDDNVAVYYALKMQCAVHHMLLQSTPSRGPRMVTVHSWPSQISMLVTTSGRQIFTNRVITSYTCVERSIKFPIGRLHCPTLQCICINATVCQAHCIPASK